MLKAKRYNKKFKEVLILLFPFCKPYCSINLNEKKQIHNCALILICKKSTRHRSLESVQKLFKIRNFYVLNVANTAQKLAYIVNTE